MTCIAACCKEHFSVYDILYIIQLDL